MIRKKKMTNPTTNRSNMKFKPGGMLPSGLSKAVIPILLSAYKFGLFYMGKLNYPGIVNRLSEAGLTEVVNERGFYFVFLTDKGAKLVEDNFLYWLTTLHPYYTYPIIKCNDRIYLEKTFHTPPHQSDLLDGTYYVAAIDSSSVLLDMEVVARRLETLKRVRLKHNIHMSFISDNLATPEEEFNYRFPLVNVKKIAKFIKDPINKLRLAEILNKVYEKRYVRERLKE